MSKSLLNKNILVLIGGSIAAYKTCSVISKLVQMGHRVRTVTTPQALNFIGPSTLEGLTGHAVLSDVFQPHHAMDHIHLARWADLILLCPATANLINKMAHGIADDLVTNLFLAHDFLKPFILAPAMNTSMYHHPSTQASLNQLKTMGIKVLEPKSGSLACGEIGAGRLMEPEEILILIQDIINHLKPSPQIKVKSDKSTLTKLKILITSGGTQEPIDVMRVITNLSTGRTGSRLAEIFFDNGYEVDFLGAINSKKPDRPCNLFTFTSFSDLNRSLKDQLKKNQYTAIIHCAAVSDFHVSKVRSDNKTNKTKKGFSGKNIKIPSNEKMIIELEPNFKILPLLKSYASKSKIKSNPFVIGFKYTSTLNMNEKKWAVEKLFTEGGVDLIVHNDHHDIDKKKDTHSFTLYFKKTQLRTRSQSELAEALVEIINTHSQKQKKVSI